ncbi:MAG: hypothetical protein HOK52_14195 [Candidatus Marinimicrobia bacterium]|jgi:hypothetical protein|nr:hypothetical protein [Candidatus Neomarinimicrobiota bacterium]MBT3937856.1 hypothetical protein [Candidatus Neomarinimicrobiota bacterium]MBT3960768.1 hypothetical protein [Candidatus Neomarinimicrobiota bacterium]MBT4383213.1 hypothetical protein [Candidatus Neomarinimicrobiota bacterium]MBT4635994.1 hypothetical protein [Candidatus Neomarinimicrobiota bacterium]
MNDIIALVGILSGIAIPLGVFVWLYFDAKNKRATIVEIAKTIDDQSKVEELISNIEGEKKKEPIELRRGGMITFFVGIGLYLLGVTALGSILKGVGLLVGTIGVGTFIAGYLFPNDSTGITKAVEEFEKE